jgi:hypothetical protein
MVVRERGRAERQRSTLTQRQLETLREIGRFRLINQADLARFRYAGRSPEMAADLARLLDREHLIERRIVVDLKRDRRMAVLVLTAKGKAWLEGDRPRQAIYNGQKFFDGFVRAREVYHDAAIYPAYRAAAQKLLAEGGVIQRVVLDHELKGIKARLTNRREPGRAENPPLSGAQKREIAEKLHLRVVDGKIHIPDLQIHYLDADGEEKFLNLEVTTDSYRGRDVSPKRASGFSMYASGSNHAGAPIWDDHHLWD